MTLKSNNAMELKIFTTEEEIRAAFSRYEDEEKLPEDFFLKRDAQFIMPVLFKEDKQIGMMFGRIDKEHAFCIIDTFYIEKEHAGRRAVVWFLDSALNGLKHRFDIESVQFSIMLTVGQESVISSSLKYLPHIKVTEVKYLRQICVKAEDCAHFKKMRWYRPELLEEKGYELVPWKDASEAHLEGMKAMEESGDHPDDYLAPGILEEWENDKDTSFLLIRKGCSDPLGWLVTEKNEEEDSLMVRRFYVNQQVRGRMLGYAFLTAALEEIVTRCEKVWYKVERGNRQMERFSNHYKYFFGYDLTEYDYDICSVHIDLKQ